MPKLFGTYILIVFTSAALLHSSASANLCTQVHADFHPRAAAEDVLTSIQNLEQKIDSIRRNWNGSYQRSTVIQARHNRSKLLASLERGDASGAIGIYRNLFREVELSYWYLREGSRDPKLVKTFGEGYGEYLATRSTLEKLSEDNGIVGSTAKRVLENLGVSALTQILPGLGVSSRKPSLLQIRSLFNSEPEFILVKLQKDLAEERKLAFKAVPLRILHVETLRSLIYQLIPERLRQPVTKLIGLSYNSYVIQRYLPEIERLMFNPNKDIKVLTNEFKDLTGKYKEDDFLLTFVRIASASETWNSIKADLASRADSKMDQALLDRMNSIEERAAKMGYLPRFEENSLVDTVIEGSIPLGTTIYLASQSSQALTEVLDVVSKFLGQ